MTPTPPPPQWEMRGPNSCELLVDQCEMQRKTNSNLHFCSKRLENPTWLLMFSSHLNTYLTSRGLKIVWWILNLGGGGLAHAPQTPGFLHSNLWHSWFSMAQSRMHFPGRPQFLCLLYRVVKLCPPGSVPQLWNEAPSHLQRCLSCARLMTASNKPLKSR